MGARALTHFIFFRRIAVLDFFCSRSLNARLPMRGTSGSVRRSPANPARPGREQRYRDRFVRRGVPEVPLIRSAPGNFRSRCHFDPALRERNLSSTKTAEGFLVASLLGMTRL